MRYILIDKVLSLESGKRIETVKGVSLAEEYLGDHFPTFPVLPGVLLLQGMVESASWLVREAQGFANSMVLLQETRNVKYKSFLAPGSQVHYSIEAKTLQDGVSSFQGHGRCGDQRIVEARFGLRHFNLSERSAALAAVDAEVIEALKARWTLLKP